MKRFFLITILVVSPAFVFAEGGYDVVFRTAPATASIIDSMVPGIDAVMSMKAAPNGGRTAHVSAGRHELVVTAAGYAPFRVSLDASRPGLVVEAKLERCSSALVLSAMIPTDDRPKSVTFTPDGRYLVVAPLSGSKINILDAATGALVASPAPPKSWASKQGFVECAFPPGRDELWVSQMYTDRIHAFSLRDFSYLRSFYCGGTFPKVILPHPDGRVFVSNWLSETISVLSADGSSTLGKMKATGIPRGMALSADGSTLYVANFGNGSIEVFDASRLTRIKVLFDGKRGLPSGGAKRHLVMDAARNRLYASDMARGSVFAYDIATDTMLAEIVIAPDAKTNTIELSPDGRWLYASTRGPNNAADYEKKGPAFGELIVIDAETLAIVERHWGGNQPTGLDVSPDGTTVAFTDFLDHRVELYTRRDR